MRNLFALAVLLFLSLPAWGAVDNPIEVKDGSPPQVNAEIVQIKVSPDQSLLALELADAKDRHSVMIFDLENKKVKAVIPDISGDFLWSKDSKNLAVLDEPNTAWAISRNGDKTRIKIGGTFYDFTWREDKADSYFYRDDDFVVHGNLESGDTDKVKMPHTVESAFNVNGKPCCSYTIREGSYQDDKTTMYAMEVDSKKLILTVPFSKEMGDWDPPTLEMSPNGRYIAVRARASGSTLFVVARTADSADVFRHPHKAIMYQTDVMVIYSINWLPIGYNDHDLAVVSEVAEFLILDLHNGNRQHAMFLGPIIKLAELWKPESGGTWEKDWLYVTKRGLEAYLDREAEKPTLLLRHKPNPKKDE